MLIDAEMNPQDERGMLQIENNAFDLKMRVSNFWQLQSFYPLPPMKNRHPLL